MHDCQPMYSFIYSPDNYIQFDSPISSAECREYMEICDEKGYFVTEILCCTSRGEYFQIHVWCSYFCQDYLVEVDGWHWKAFEHHLICYESEVLSKEPDNIPVFYLSVAKTQPNDEEKADINNMVNNNRSNTDFVPRNVNKSKQVKSLVID